MTNCVIEGCENEGTAKCSFMVSGYGIHDLYCDDCHAMVDLMCAALRSQQRYCLYKEEVAEVALDELVKDAQRLDWKTYLVFSPSTLYDKVP